jgi:hypothetical protein
MPCSRYYYGSPKRERFWCRETFLNLYKVNNQCTSRLTFKSNLSGSRAQDFNATYNGLLDRIQFEFDLKGPS